MNKMLLAVTALVAAPLLAQPAPPPMAPVPGVQPAVPGVAPAMPQMHRMMRMGATATMTRAEVTDHVRQMFAMLDTNRDGAIDQAERTAARGHMQMQMMHGPGMAKTASPAPGAAPQPPAMDRNGAFDRIDANRDGTISRDEFARAPAPRMQMRRVMIMRGGGSLFAAADGNGDGRVTLAEATALALRHFDTMDSNHDGRITPDERGQGRMRMMRSMRQG